MYFLLFIQYFYQIYPTSVTVPYRTAPHYTVCDRISKKYYRYIVRDIYRYIYGYFLSRYRDRYIDRYIKL